MKKHFYSHLIEIDSITIKLDTLDLSLKEKENLLKIVDSSLHHTILDTILSELSQEDKKIFLEYFSTDDHNQIWEFLNKKIANVEGKIKKATLDLKEKLHNDIDELV